MQATELGRRLKIAPGTACRVLNRPPSFAGRLESIDGGQADLVLLFAAGRTELERDLAGALAALKPGGRLWIAYPGGNTADLSRNHGWGSLQKAGLGEAEEVSLDGEWSAKRFEAASALLGAEIPGADMLPVGRRARPVFVAVRFLARMLFRLMFRFDVQGLERVSGGPYVLICNHLGWMDAVSLLLLFPAEPRIHFLADPTSMMRNRPLWMLVRAAGGIVPVSRIQRDHRVLFAQVGRCLERGGVVALFPEGDFGPGEGRLLPFKKGFAHFAVDGHVPVVPVGMAGMQELWLGKRLFVRVGEAISTQGRGVDEVLALGQQAVAALLPSYHDPGGRKPLRRRLTGLF